MTPSRRGLWGLVPLGAALAAALAALWWLAADGVETTLRARHEDGLRQVVAALERRLGERVAREEARPFLEYRYLYVPLDNANPAVVRSPLSKDPGDPAVRGFFTLDPDGTFRSPTAPRGNELALVQQKNWSPGPVDPELEALVRSLPLSEDGTASTETVPGSALRDRPARFSQLVNTKRYNVDTWASDRNGFSPGDDADRDVTVEVRPFRGFRRGDDLILVRDVLAEGVRYRQGLVIDLPRLTGEVGEDVLAEVGTPGVALSWDGQVPPGRWSVAHRFAPPLQDLQVAVAMDEVTAWVGPARGAVRGLGGAVLLLLVGAAVLVARAVRVELAYAERRSDFVSAVTHELKTPLTAIRMYAEMLRDGMVPAERHREYLGTMLSESDRLGRLVANVLTLSQLERGTAAPAPIVGDVAEVLRDALEVVRPHAAAHGFALEVEPAPALPPVRLDRDGLVQVVVNLVDNAVKFASDGERRIHFVLRPHDGGVSLAVRDRGPGVPAGQLARVFEPFWRGERELVRRTRGTGLGLSLVKGLVEGMGGGVSARNAPGGGFEVEIRLTAA